MYVGILGRRPRIQSILVDAARALNDALVNTGYENPCDYIGSYLKRTIAGTDIWSTHSYGIAFDIDYGGDNPDSPDHPGIDNNPHLHDPIERGDPRFGVEFQLLEHQVNAVEAIKNLDGDQMWRWLGWPIGDTMHFQINIAPQFATVDWTTVAGHEPEEPMTAAFAEWVEGWVEGLDAEHVTMLHTAGIIRGNLDYWLGLLNIPDHEAWLYFYTRAQASTWAKIGNL
ncbi:hypothetical protein ACFL0N_01720 [Pseudomonadota bacterium]